MFGIAGYACHFPRAALTAGTVRATWGAAPSGLESKRVAAADEDALTLALAAARGVRLDGVTAIGLASTTLPYARRVQAGLLVDALGLSQAGTFVSEHTTSGRAGTEALCLHVALARGSLVAAAEVATGPAAGAQDASLGAGAAAIVLGPEGRVATVEASDHFVAEDPGLAFTETGEEHRRDVEVPAYALAARERALRATLPDDAAAYRFAVLDGPDARTVGRVARACGIDDRQWRPVWPFPRTGDLGAANTLVGLCMALDAAEPGERILVLSYGTGSAADALSLRAGPDVGLQGDVVERALRDRVDLDYPAYLRIRGVL